jgi:GMP synthase-like glutamine amidotransferase
MKTLCVLQHAEAEYLGLMEDHLEGRNIRFSYQRPFAAGGTVPRDASGYDGLILLGGGPYGVVSGPLLPSLAAELRLTRSFLDAGLPVIGIGLGAVILAVAADGGADEAPLRFAVETAQRSTPDALAGQLPERFPVAAYLRDRPVLPVGAEVLATVPDGTPVIFALPGRCLGFLGHPGAKTGMIEDLIMEFAETPEDTADTMTALRRAQADIATALGPIMVGIIEVTELM